MPILKISAENFSTANIFAVLADQCKSAPAGRELCRRLLYRIDNMRACEPFYAAVHNVPINSLYSLDACVESFRLDIDLHVKSVDLIRGIRLLVRQRIKFVEIIFHVHGL